MNKLEVCKSRRVAGIAALSLLMLLVAILVCHPSVCPEAQRSALPPVTRVQAEARTPRVEDVGDLHVREDLLLENYTWADSEHTRVRIPIERAMELLAERGLPVVNSSGEIPSYPLTGVPSDFRRATSHPVEPLTRGFTPTAAEQGYR